MSLRPMAKDVCLSPEDPASQIPSKFFPSSFKGSPKDSVQPKNFHQYSNLETGNFGNFGNIGNIEYQRSKIEIEDEEDLFWRQQCFRMEGTKHTKKSTTPKSYQIDNRKQSKNIIQKILKES